MLDSCLSNEASCYLHSVYSSLDWFICNIRRNEQVSTVIHRCVNYWCHVAHVLSRVEHSTVPLGCSLRNFHPLTVVNVITAVRLLPGKQRTSDPLPTRALKEHIDNWRCLSSNCSIVRYSEASFQLYSKHLLFIFWTLFIMLLMMVLRLYFFLLISDLRYHQIILLSSSVFLRALMLLAQLIIGLSHICLVGLTLCA